MSANSNLRLGRLQSLSPDTEIELVIRSDNFCPQCPRNVKSSRFTPQEWKFWPCSPDDPNSEVSKSDILFIRGIEIYTGGKTLTVSMLKIHKNYSPDLED